MQTSTAPRHFTQGADMAGISSVPGLPGDRMARIAARRAFVELKQTYLLALSEASEDEAGWLRNQVRSAEQPVDLWLLRAPVFAVLSGTDPDRRRRRQMLRRGLDSMFMDTQPPSSFVSL
jgi:hypothetical protein